MAIARKPMRTHQVQGGQVEAIQYMEYVTGQTFILGEILIWGLTTDIGKVKVAGTDAASNTIVGIALAAAGTAPGFDAANSPTTFTGRSQKISVSRPNDQTIYQAEMTNGSSTVVVPVTLDIGVVYGVTAYSGIWTVDRNKTSATRVSVTGIDTDQNVVFFKFILPVAP